MPTEINQDLLNQVTLRVVLNEMMADTVAAASALDDLIEEHGFAVVRLETLRQLVPKYDQMLEDALKELGDKLAAGDGQFEGTAFHNLSKKNMDADVGGGSRTLGKLDEHGACRLLLNAISGALTNENHHLLRSIDHGILQISGIHCKKLSENASKHDDPQIAHLDHVVNPVPYGRVDDDVHEANLKCLSNSRAAVRTLWCNMEKDSVIRLAIFWASHKLAQQCELCYARHYRQVQQAAFSNHGIKEADILPYWTQIQATWLRARFHEREPAQSTTVPTRFGDIIVMAGNQLHYGLGDKGLRLFASTVLDEHSDTSDLQNGFAHVHSSIGLVDQSLVYAGMRGHCLPDSVAVSFDKVLANLTKQLAAAWPAEAAGTRSRNLNLTRLLGSILKRLDADDKSRSRPVPSQNVQSIGNVVGIELKEGCNKKRPLILYLDLRRSEEKGKGVYRYIRNSSAILNAILNSHLALRTKRSANVSVSDGAWTQFAGRGCVLDNITICYSVVEFAGEPLERMFELWDDRRELEEKNRWRFQALFQGVEHLWTAGFRFVYFHWLMLVFFAGKIKLVMAGCGYLGPSDATARNGSFLKNMIQAGRKSTSCYSGEHKFPVTVDKTYLKSLEKLEKEQAKAADCREGDGELSDVQDEELSDVEVDGPGFGGKMLERRDLNNAFEKLRETTKGSPYQPPEETFADTDLWHTVFDDGKDKLDHMMVRESDFHQLMLWIAFRLQVSRKPALSQAEFTKACRTMTYLEGDRCQEEAIQFVLENCIADGTRAASNRSNRANPISQQPGATGRLAQLVGLSLLSIMRTHVRDELSLMPFASLPIYPPKHETQLAGGGIPVKVAKFPIRDDVDFQMKALRAIQRAGLTAPDNDRTVLLINEGVKGVGSKLVDDCKQNEFAGFYIGRAGEGWGRFVASSPGQGEGVGQKCDAEPCEDLPLTWFIESGVPCPFFNGVSDEAEANIKLCRAELFTHVFNKTDIICIPMGFKDFTKAGSYAAWKYTHNAVSGRYLKF